jgi:hypothetical protein
MLSSFLAEKAPKSLPEGSIEKEHVEDLLGLASPPRKPTNLVDKFSVQQEGLREGNLGKGVDSFMFFDDWIDGISIGCDPLIYRGGGLIPIENMSMLHSPSFLR